MSHNSWLFFMMRFLFTAATLMLGIALEPTLPLYAPQNPWMHGQTEDSQGGASPHVTLCAPQKPPPYDSAWSFSRLASSYTPETATPQTFLSSIQSSKQPCRLIMQTGVKTIPMNFIPTEGRLIARVTGQLNPAIISVCKPFSEREIQDLSLRPIDDLFDIIPSSYNLIVDDRFQLRQETLKGAACILCLSAPEGDPGVSKIVPPAEVLKSDLITHLYLDNLTVSEGWLHAVRDVIPSLKGAATNSTEILPQVKGLTCENGCTLNQFLKKTKADQARAAQDAKDGTAS